MAQQHQLIGMIEIDAGPTSFSPVDTTLGEMLVSLRSPTEPCAGDETVEQPRNWTLDANLPDSVHVLNADLGQLSWDLEVELRQFIERLLART